MSSTVIPGTSKSEQDKDEDGWMETETQHSPAPSRASTSNHSEIEKRRRDRMNELICELNALLPAASNRKLDKLSVLRLALQHIASLTSAGERDGECSGNGDNLPATELLSLLERSVEGFLVVTDVDTGNIVYASESVSRNTSMSVEDFTSRNWFDLIHPDDAMLFKKEILSVHMENRLGTDPSCEYLNDCVSSSTSCYPQQNEMDIGFKRSFLCRINIFGPRKIGTVPEYQRFRCSGILRDSNPPTAVILLVKCNDQYVTENFQIKISPNGRILACDNELTSALGYLPHKLLANSYYDIVIEGDLIDVSHHHSQVLKSMEVRKASYRLRTETNESVMVDCTWQPFINPWTEQLQFIVLLHSPSVIRKDKELTPEQSTLKQLLSTKQGPTTLLGAARFGDTIGK